MKNLKTITTALLLLFTFTSAFSQTEEETIEWLKKYGEQEVTLMENGYKYTFKIDNKNMHFYTEANNEGVGHKKVYEHFELKSLKHLDFDDSSALSPWLGYEAISYLFNFNDYVVKGNLSQTWPNADPHYAEWTGNKIEIQFESKEKGEQIIKAIVHLAKLYGAKPRPKVSEDMFK